MTFRTDPELYDQAYIEGESANEDSPTQGMGEAERDLFYANRERELLQRITALEQEIEISDRKWIVDGKCKFCGGHPDGKGVNKCYCIPAVREYRVEWEEDHQRIAALEAENIDLSRRLSVMIEVATGAEDQRDATRHAAAAFYRYIVAEGIIRSHLESCDNCLNEYACAEWVRLTGQANVAFAEATEVAKEFKP